MYIVSVEAATGEADSDDDAPRDVEIPPVLDANELTTLSESHKAPYYSYLRALSSSFTNADGKEFVKRFCNFLIPTSYETRYSTNPTGKYQPGSMRIQWVVKGDPSDRQAKIPKTNDATSATNDPTSATNDPTSAKSPNDPSEERVADVVIRDK